MRIAQLRAENFRLFAHLSLAPGAGLNFFTGENAAGKSSLLEAVYCAARAKSFRAGHLGEMAGAQGRHWRLAVQLQDARGLEEQISLQWSAGEGLRMGSTQEPALTTAALAGRLPTQILEPDLHRLVQEGPGQRRSFLDWGLFHVEPSFLPLWRRYQRALRQRNLALRHQRPAREIQAWDPELAAQGETLHQLRQHYLEQLTPRFQAELTELLPGAEARIELSRGWPERADLATALQQGLSRDLRLGSTSEGPHRMEFRVRLDGHPIKGRISRGQQKLLISALLLAQATQIGELGRGHPVLLVDDLTAELAQTYQARLLARFGRYPGQRFITSFEPPAGLTRLPDLQLFHVEHGGVRQC
jgi:DNA replication and repair protein RecF